jgi:hypothetical protein
MPLYAATPGGRESWPESDWTQSQDLIPAKTPDP